MMKISSAAVQIFVVLVIPADLLCSVVTDSDHCNDAENILNSHSDLCGLKVAPADFRCFVVTESYHHDNAENVLSSHSDLCGLKVAPQFFGHYRI